MTDPDLTRKVQYLIDRQEIADCVNRYSRALDRHDDDLLESVFHEDAIDNHGPWVGARAEFVQWANHECHNKLDAHMHHITTHNCEIDGDEAHAESYVQFVHRYREGTSVLVAGARYIDRLERRDGEWRIALRRVVLDYRYLADGEIFTQSIGYPGGTWDRSDMSYERPLGLPTALEQELDRKGASAPAGER